MQGWVTMTVVLRYYSGFWDLHRGLLIQTKELANVAGTLWSQATRLVVIRQSSRGLSESIKIQSRSNQNISKSKNSFKSKTPVFTNVCVKASKTPLNLRKHLKPPWMCHPKHRLESLQHPSSPRPNSSQPGPVRQCILHPWEDTKHTECILKYSNYITDIMY